MPSVVDNNLYSQPPYVHLYPSHPYPHAQQTTYIQPGEIFNEKCSIIDLFSSSVFSDSTK
jgi:hypothetical protein